MKNEIIRKIKEKKELSDIADEVVSATLSNYLKKNSFVLEKLSNTDKKVVVSEVRAQLRRLSGQYQRSFKSKINLSYEEILKSHSSTAERSEFYPKLKKIIKRINPKSILDLGCGVNPLALAIKGVKYYASDIKEGELKVIAQYFKKNKINGKTFVYDLREPNSQLPGADLTLILKVLDILEENPKKRNIIVTNLLNKIISKNLIVSFATKKISGKPMNNPQRTWFESILNSKKYPFKKIYSNNEIFYVIHVQQIPSPL